LKLIEKLSLIHKELKVPKNLTNSFGKYKYRNCEGILKAVKPYEEKHKVCLMLTDEIVSEGDRCYIKSTATLKDLESDEYEFSVGYAREPEIKKGMDESQITGTASSYARKYALNALFLLDDTKDVDSDAYRNQVTAMAKQQDSAELATTKKGIVSTCANLGGTKNEELMKVLKAVIPSGNPNAIRDIDKAKELLETLKTIKPVEKESK